MHRYDELEKLYYKKKYQKIFFIVCIVSTIIILLVLFVKRQNNINQKIVYHPEKSKINRSFKNKKINQTDNISDINTTKPKKRIIAEKSLQKLKFILPDIKEKEITSKKVQTKVKKITYKKKRMDTVSNNIRIKETSIDNINTLINDYKKNPDYDLAIMISKFFFTKNNLKNAKKWALKANEINPERIESWIVFADVLIKEHKLQKAKKILRAYINSYGQNDIIEKKLRSIDE